MNAEGIRALIGLLVPPGPRRDRILAHPERVVVTDQDGDQPEYDWIDERGLMEPLGRVDGPPASVN